MVLHDSHHMSVSGDCGESEPSSAASEDVLDLQEAFVNTERLRDSVSLLLNGLGEDVSREGLRDTPKRVAKAWLAASEGYAQSVHSVLGGALFHEEMSSKRNDSIVLIRDVDFASTSEHNLLPFFGRCHIAYIPRQGLVLGLSKVARLAKMFAKRFQNQQRFTNQMLDAFNAEVQPLGCAALVEASHLGDDVGPSKLTFSSLGCFYANPKVYLQEFASLLGRPNICKALARPPQSVACNMSSREDTEDQQNVVTSASGSVAMECTSLSRMEAAVQGMLREVGEDPDREGLQGSARRYVEHLLASTARDEHLQTGQCALITSSRLAECLAASYSGALQSFEIRFTSQCEHHLLPFHGLVQVVMLPSGSPDKLDAESVRWIVNTFSKRLQIQERLTHQIAQALQSSTDNEGLLIVCRAAHMCMVARGVEQHASTTVTSVSYGRFQRDHELRICTMNSLQTDRASN